MMLSCWKYHDVERRGLDGKVPYGTQYLFLAKNKRKVDEKLCLYIFIVSRTTKTQVDHNNKTAVT
jgi:hypothetical protein